MSRPPRRRPTHVPHARSHAHGTGSLRIIGGTLGGRRIGTIGDRRVRPMPDRMRTALFNALDSRDLLTDARILDAFAGSGAMGIEALSRGAAHATFFERDRDIFAQLRENLAALDLGTDVARAVFGDVLTEGVTLLPPWLAPPIAAANAASEAESGGLLLFLDPPYDYLREPFAVEFLARTHDLLAHLAPEDSPLARPVCVVLGHDFDVTIPPALGRFECRETREYGRTRLTFYGDWD